MDINKLFIILVWGIGIYSFFKLKKIVKETDSTRHDEIFGRHWTEHSISTTANYLKLVFVRKNWLEFNSRQFTAWAIIAYVCNLLAVCVIFYPLIKIFLTF